MKRITNPKTIQKGLEKRKLSEDQATDKAAQLTDDEKNNIQATVLRELTLVCTNRIRLLEKVLGRKVKISTSAPMGIPDYSDNPHGDICEDKRTFKITVE